MSDQPVVRQVTLDEVGLLTMDKEEPCVRCGETTLRFSLFFESPLHPECEIIWIHEHDKQVADEEGQLECLMKNTLAGSMMALSFAFSNLRDKLLQELFAMFGVPRKVIEVKGEVSQEQVEAIRKAWDEHQSGDHKQNIEVM